MIKMKDSGIPWIGQIPEDWEVCKVKNFFIYKKRIVGDDAENWQRLALTLNGVIKRSKDDSEGLQPEKFEGYQILMQNELVFKLIDLNNIQTSRVGLSNYDGIVSPAYIILSPQNISVLFSYYYFISLYYRNIFNTLGDDGVRSSLNSLDLLNLKIVVPPQEIQQKIVEILDKKCGQIDELVRIEENEIEKLKEYKTSLITKVVTKGLDPNAKMKDSGIPWIGQIPEDWKIGRLKFYAQIKTGSTPPTNIKQYFDENINWFTPSDFKNMYLNNSERKIASSFLTDFNITLFPLKTTLLVGIGATCGKIALINNEGYCNQQITAIVASNNIDRKFMFYEMSAIQKYLKENALYTTLPILNNEYIKNINIIIADIEIQQQIVDYLDKRCEEIDNLIKIKQEKIEKLKEYKKSLIYQYVTGKKEVV